MPLDHVDEMIPVKPASCRQCRQPLTGDDPHPMRHQVIEVPQVQARVTEYRMHTLRCTHCTTLTEAEWPEGVPGNAFGPSVQAWVGLLSGSYRMSKRNRLALVNIFQENPLEEANGVWTDALDEALGQAAEQASIDRCALILVLHSWVLPGFVAPGEDPGTGIVKGANRLIETVARQPSIVAIFTGHRHLNRLRMFRDFLIVDTACLIGFPMGFREIHLKEDGYLVARFHQLDLPQVLQASYDRSSLEVNDRWQGEVHDRDTEILLPRLREVWS